MKCLVINLDRSPERLAFVTGEFSRIGVAFERVAAVDGCNRTDLAQPPRLSSSEVACFLSHRLCWRIIAESDDAYGAIFEDDIVLTETARPLLVDAGWIPADADIVKTETILWKTTIGIRRRSAGHGFSVVRLFGDHHGTAGYIVSKKAAHKLIQATESFHDAVDDYLFGHSHMAASGLRIYQVSPALCAQDRSLGVSGHGLASDIDLDRRFGPNIRPKQTIVGREVRRFLRQIHNLWRGRWHKKIPFDYRGRRFIRPA